MHRGLVPSTFEELEALPGVGHKTASVVMIYAFGYVLTLNCRAADRRLSARKTAFPVDTHIHRLAQRWGLTSGKSVVQTV